VALGGSSRSRTAVTGAPGGTGRRHKRRPRPTGNEDAWFLSVFVLLVALLAVGLTLNPREVPSPLIDPAPAFSLPQLLADLAFSTKDMRGSVAPERVGVVVRRLSRRASTS
jgi:hypothetical protein